VKHIYRYSSEAVPVNPHEYTSHFGHMQTHPQHPKSDRNRECVPEVNKPLYNNPHPERNDWEVEELLEAVPQHLAHDPQGSLNGHSQTKTKQQADQLVSAVSADSLYCDQCGRGPHRYAPPLDPPHNEQDIASDDGIKSDTKPQPSEERDDTEPDMEALCRHAETMFDPEGNVTHFLISC
jgi:hypothetical protein